MDHHTESYIESWNQWQNLHKHGGSDPFWSDGVNMNLVRNHMLYAIRKGAEPLEDMPLPDEIDRHYMADAKGIVARAETALAKLRSDPYYQQVELTDHLMIDSEATEDLDRVKALVRRIDLGLKESDLVTLRSAVMSIDYDAPRKALEKIESVKSDGDQIALFEVV